MIFDYFDGGFYLNLDKRTERKEAFEKRSKEAGFEVERFPAIQLKEEDVPNPFNGRDWHIKISCTYSHFEMIKEAKRRGWKNCVVFEDDCVFVDGFMQKAQNCINELKNIEWDMFFLGGEPNKETEYYSDNIVKTDGIYGAHSYIVNHTFYDKILSANLVNGIDILYLNLHTEDKKYYLSREILCNQDGESYSDIWGQTIKRDEVYKNAYKLYVK
jgi:GR25 family glycosyltransferase involved in LPS biosynthesis